VPRYGFYLFKQLRVPTTIFKEPRIIFITPANFAMAETAATAIGIAGAASVLQSVLQCYRDFLVARDFGRDYETRVVKLDLLQLSMKNWGLAIGLINQSGAAQNQFHVSQSTEENIQVVKRSITHIKRLFEDANNALDEYKQESSTAAEANQSQETNQVAVEDKRWKAVSRKIHRTVHREHDQGHPGTIKRGQWALLDKERIDKLIEDITTVVDRLRTDFPPVDKAQLQKLYHKELLNMGLTDEDLVMLKNVAKSKDTLLKEVADMAVKERQTGHLFKNFDTTNGSAVILGDFFANEQQRSPGASSYTGIKTAAGSLTMAGNIYGGKNPLDTYIQKMEPAKATRAG
jgi:hypothetical protein